jgi:hypothetical protein
MSFKIGDRVVIVKSPFPERIGVVCIIVEIVTNAKFTGYPPWDKEPYRSLLLSSNTACNLGIPDVTGLPRPAIYPDTCIELYKDDGQEKGEWTEDLIRICKPSNIPEKV